MNMNDPIWNAGITWNTLSLTGNNLDLHILDNRLNMYPEINNTNNSQTTTNTFFHFPKQRRTSTLNNLHKKIFSHKLLFNGINNVRNVKDTSLSTNDGGGNRLLRIKSKAIYSSKK